MIILDMDMPKNCSECPLTAYSDMYVEDNCVVGGTYDEDKRPDDCPIVAEIMKEIDDGYEELRIVKESD